jgi:hypothetical protein
MKELESFDGLPSTTAKKDDWADATASNFNYLARMKQIKDFILPPSDSSSTLLKNLKKTLRNV